MNAEHVFSSIKTFMTSNLVEVFYIGYMVLLAIYYVTDEKLCHVLTFFHTCVALFKLKPFRKINKFCS